MTDPALQPILQAALADHQAGRLDAAAAGYARLLARDPDDLNAIYLSGMVALQRRDFATAHANIARAVAAKPDHADLQNNLGEALRGLSRYAEAEAAYRRALAVAPDHAGAIGNLAIVLRQRDDLAAAHDGFRRAIELEPMRADHHSNLAGLLISRGRFAEAEQCYRRALALDPQHARAMAGLGDMLRRAGRAEEARTLLRRAHALAPDDPAVLGAVADLDFNDGRTAEAEALCREALRRQPDDADCLTILAAIAARRGETETAVAHVEQLAEALAGGSPRVQAFAGGARLFYLQYSSRIDAAALARAHFDWAARHAPPGRATSPAIADRDPARRLKIGFVSPDFRAHPVAIFLEPVLAALDRGAVSVACYSDVPRPDDTTARLRALADVWRPTLGATDAEVAAQVEADRIDILIDLAGHTADNRLLVFAARPAPVQATWLGYPGTTGLRAIDWRISDAVCDPPEDDVLSAERLLRLPGFHCYVAPADAPAPTARPLEQALTFGSFNNVMKISDDCAALFARTLAAVPDSQLLLKSSIAVDEDTRRLHVERIARHGVDPARIAFAPRIEAQSGHLSAYGAVDVALDTFPYNGTTTTCEALWMGVPVLTLKGDRHAARVGASLLGQVGLDEFVATGAADFVDRAARWAGRRAALADVRAGLRARMAASALCDPAGFARRLEAALRAMWHDRLARS
ncbi:MAG: tetratricopeptide repeat protein [Alphaproteobacteria bacterium]|nr:tetratricopeptide repeat protein [Alphaproteobacteria bacterium]